MGSGGALTVVSGWMTGWMNRTWARGQCSAKAEAQCRGQAARAGGAESWIVLLPPITELQGATGSLSLLRPAWQIL